MAKKKAKKKKSIIKMMNPFTLFGKRRVFSFVFIVLGVSAAIVSYLVFDLYQLRRQIERNNQTVRTFNESEYNLLLSTPTIVDYIFPDSPMQTQAMIGPWRSQQNSSQTQESVAGLWLDPQDLGIEQLPDLSEQNLIDYISELKAKDPNF